MEKIYIYVMDISYTASHHKLAAHGLITPYAATTKISMHTGPSADEGAFLAQKSITLY